MRVFTRARAFLFVAAWTPLGCVDPGEQTLDDQDPHQPGDALGSFAVTGKLADDDCGADALDAPQTWSFQIKLSRQGTTLYWLNGREAIVGDIDRNGRFSFETSVDQELAARRGAAKGCTIVRRDSASGSLDASDASFSGKLSYGYAATSDSDCSEFTGTNGAPSALPCALSYALAAERIEPAN